MKNLITQIQEEFDEKFYKLRGLRPTFDYFELKDLITQSNLRVIEAIQEWASNYFLKNHNHHEEESSCVDSNYPYINSLKMEEDLKHFLSTLIEQK